MDRPRAPKPVAVRMVLGGQVHRVPQTVLWPKFEWCTRDASHRQRLGFRPYGPRCIVGVMTLETVAGTSG